MADKLAYFDGASKFYATPMRGIPYGLNVGVSREGVF
jgi:hypothetical protein